MALLSLLSTGALAAEPARVAQEDSAATLEKARASFHQGVQLFNEGSFEAALAEFRKAYRLSPSYRLLFNIGQTYVELHDYVNAQRTLKQYLQDGGFDITPARRAQVDELLAKLEERIAFLEIAADVDGAEVRVDDITVGTSPLAGPVSVNAGPRRVSATKSGYGVASRAITVAGTEKATIKLQLTELAPVRAAEAIPPRPLPKAAVVHLESRPPPSRTGLIVSLTTTVVFAAATGVFGWLALNAKNDFESELDKIPNTRAKVDDARNRTKTFAYLTDGFGAATVVSGGVALYFALTRGNGKSRPKSSVTLSPTAGGVLLQGTW